MPTITDWQLTGSNNQPIHGNTHMPKGEPDAAIGVLIISHGFKGYKDYGFFPALAEAASAAGLIAHRFNFSHSGMTNNIETFEKPELFEQDTWRKQSADLRTVIQAVDMGDLHGKGLPLVLFGHSRGGVTTLLTAAEPDVNKQLTAVITAASPSACSRLDDDQKASLKQAGKLESPSSRTGQMLYVGRIWRDEIDADPDWHDPCRAIAGITQPVQLIHGTDDTTIPLAEAHELHQANPRANLLVIDNAGHTFNAPNPLSRNQTPPPETKQMIDAACDFAVQHARS